MSTISLRNISLQFKVRRERSASLKEFLLRGKFIKSRNPVMEVVALDSLNLQIDEGERIGIIGHNGAGKSTLLRLLGGIYPPTSGELSVSGAVCSLFDFTLGFEPMASGRENIYYRGYLQGESPSQMQEKLEEIIEFSELGDFIDTPVRFYSSGMTIRLGFSIATSVEPDIFLVDECLTAGDTAFQEKAKRRMRELMDSCRVLVVVSHDIQTITEMCSRVIWMEHGRIKLDGPPEYVTSAYLQSMSCDSENTSTPGGNTLKQAS